MKTSSAKAKGRRCAQEIKEKLLEHWPKYDPAFGGTPLEDDDIIVTPSGVTGEDIKLSPRARKAYPFSIEAKNQETAKVWEWIKQAKEHSQGTNRIPLVVFKRNHETLKVCLEFDDFLKLLSSNTGHPGLIPQK